MTNPQPSKPSFSYVVALFHPNTQAADDPWTSEATKPPLFEAFPLRKASPLLLQGIAQTIASIKLRMDEAKRLLRETKRSVVEIALDVGYSNPSHFTQLFRREAGLSPSDYRQQR